MTNYEIKIKIYDKLHSGIVPLEPISIDMNAQNQITK